MYTAREIMAAIPIPPLQRRVINGAARRIHPAPSANIHRGEALMNSGRWYDIVMWGAYL